MAKTSPRPTESELQILAVLWERGPVSVREVHQHLGREAGYTTVLKLMQIMTDKGLLLRDRQGKSHIYRPAVAPERMQKTLVGDFLHRAFGGSIKKLMVAALSDEKTSAKDLAEIRALLDQVEAARGAASKAEKPARKAD